MGQWGSRLSAGSRLLEVLEAKLGIVGRGPMRCLLYTSDAADE